MLTCHVTNNPLRYIDPSGHVPIDCYGTSYCGASNSKKLPDPPKPKRDRDNKPPVVVPVPQPPGSPSVPTLTTTTVTSSSYTTIQLIATQPTNIYEDEDWKVTVSPQVSISTIPYIGPICDWLGCNIENKKTGDSITGISIGPSSMRITTTVTTTRINTTTVDQNGDVISASSRVNTVSNTKIEYNYGYGWIPLQYISDIQHFR
ncbi:MAG: hypothetical protein L0287_05070 [Anaerolineae bacterium]|nr:hypothetical protein [Anaerolineae bacterium]